MGARREPAQIHRVSSWRMLKGRNSTGSSRIPSRLAHRARPIRQSRTGAACRGCYRPPRRPPDQPASSFTPPLRWRGDGRSPTSIRKSSVPRGVPLFGPGPDPVGVDTYGQSCRSLSWRLRASSNKRSLKAVPALLARQVPDSPTPTTDRPHPSHCGSSVIRCHSRNRALCLAVEPRQANR